MSSNNGSRKVLKATAIVAVAATIALLSRGEPAPSRRATAREWEAGGARGPEAAPRQGHAVYGFAAGDVLRYRFEETQSLDALLAEGGATSADAPAGVETYVAGVLVVRVYASDARGVLAGLSVDEFRAEARTGGAPGPVARGLAAQMGEETLVLLEPDGRVAQIVCAPAAGREARNLWRDLLSRWQAVRPREPASEWTTSEEDVTGVYAAEYRVLDARTIEKRKVRYETFHGGDVEMARAASIEGNAELRTGDVLESIRSREELEIRPEGEPTLVRARSRFDLLLLDRATSCALPAAAAEAAGRLRAGDATTIGGVELPASAGQAVEASDIATELRGLKMLLDSGRRDPKAELYAMVRIVAALQAGDEAPAALLRCLDDSPDDERLGSILLGALGAAGTEAAQRALASVLLGAERPEATRMMALTAIVQVERPTVELEDALRSLAGSEGDLGTSALLLLGAVGNRVRDGDPDRFSRIRDRLLAAAEASRGDLSAHVAALEAIGNLAPREVPAIVRSALASEEEALRIAAVHVLEHVNGTLAESLLVGRLSGDPDEGVRLAAVGSLASRAGPEVVDCLLVALRSDTSEEVRCACLRALAARATDEAARELCDRVVKEDPSSSVREAAEVLLRS